MISKDNKFKLTRIINNSVHEPSKRNVDKSTVKYFSLSKKHRKWTTTFRVLKLILHYHGYSFSKFLNDNMKTKGMIRHRIKYSKLQSSQLMKIYFQTKSKKRWITIICKLYRQVISKTNPAINLKLGKMNNIRLTHIQRMDFKQQAKENKIKRAKLRKIRSKKLAQTAKKRYKKVSANFLHIDEAKCKEQAQNERSVINEALDK